MIDATANNKQIAKNTLMLYVRMLVLMVISLYTSRIVLQALGIEDYGIVNVVYGIVVLFTFVNGALTTGTQRHLSYELGRKDGNPSKIFSACFRIHVALAICFAVVTEIVGGWFLNTHMVFPEGRLAAANIVFQFSVLSTFVAIVRVPYDAAIVAWEKFTFYAYSSILEGILKLLVAIYITSSIYDKLIVFSSLQTLSTILIFTFVVVYCHNKLRGLKFVKVNDRQQYKYILSFSGWTLFGSAAVMGETQGLNVIINLFYGVSINAAIGVATKVKSVVQQFTLGFQTALNPQLVKAQAGNNKDRQFDLIYKSSKFSFYILFLLAAPLMLNVNYIFSLWLGLVPPYTAIITILCLIVSLLECLSSPLYTTIFAIGNIKIYQIIVSAMRLISIIFAFVLCKLDALPYTVFIAPCFVNLLLLLYRIVFVSQKTGMKYKDYIKKVLLPIFCVLVLCTPLLIYRIGNGEAQNIQLFLVQSFGYVFLIILIILYVGLNNSERIIIINSVKNKIIKNNENSSR